MSTGEAALDFPWLSLSLWLPLALGLPPLLLARHRHVVGAAATVATATQAVLAIIIVAKFNHSINDYQLIEEAQWLPALGISYKLGVDGVSILLVLLTGILGPIVAVTSWLTVKRRVNEFFAALIILQTGMLGVFVALDFVLFYVFWELVLIPMYLIIGVWGGERRIYATVKFFLYTFAGSVLMLVAILAIRFYAGTFDITQLPATMAQAPLDLQRWVFVAFFLAFAIKVPMFPFHTWLPDAHVEAPTGGSVLLAAVLLKMGAYGFLRFALPLTPGAVDEARGLMVALSLVAIIYGALVAMVQPDLKKLIAYSSVSHMGFVTLGIFTQSQTGIEGAIIQMFSHGLVTGALFLAVGIIYERAHTRLIADFGGLAARMPVYAVTLGFFTLASLGLPLLSGFVGELLVLVGAFRYSIAVGLVAAIGVILAAAYMLWMYQRVMLGLRRRTSTSDMQDMNLVESGAMLALAAGTVLVGVAPGLFVAMLQASTAGLAG